MGGGGTEEGIGLPVPSAPKATVAGKDWVFGVYWRLDFFQRSSQLARKGGRATRPEQKVNGRRSLDQ